MITDWSLATFNLLSCTEFKRSKESASFVRSHPTGSSACDLNCDLQNLGGRYLSSPAAKSAPDGLPEKVQKHQAHDCYMVLCAGDEVQRAPQRSSASIRSFRLHDRLKSFPRFTAFLTRIMPGHHSRSRMKPCNYGAPSIFPTPQCRHVVGIRKYQKFVG